MKSRLLRAFAILAVVALVVPALPSLAGEEAHKATSVFAVDGMTCGGCAAKIRVSVKEMAGVDDIKVSHDDNKATVTYDTEKVTVEQITETIQKLGFKAKVEKTEKAT